MEEKKKNSRKGEIKRGHIGPTKLLLGEHVGTHVQTKIQKTELQMTHIYLAAIDHRKLNITCNNIIHYKSEVEIPESIVAQCITDNSTS